MTLENILRAFLMYRPDLGYVNESMANIAAIFIHTLSEEGMVFKCFINMVHQYHFHALFRGEMSEVKMRVDYFDS